MSPTAGSRRGTSAADRAERAARCRPRPAGPEFVLIGRYAAPAGRHAGPHRYAVWKLTYYHEGSIDALVDGERHPVTAGSVLAVPPGSMHEERASTAYANSYLLVNAPATWGWPRLAQDDGSRSLERAFVALLRESAAPDGRTAAMAAALLAQVDITLRRLADAQAGTPRRATVVRAEQILAEEHTGRLRIEDLARRVGVSVSTLRAHFMAEVGVSPQARLRELRLHRALGLLAASDLTVEAVAARTGYSSASHLSRHLREATGRTPGEQRGDGRHH